MLSSQAHVATQSAIGKREDRLPATLALACDPVSEESASLRFFIFSQKALELVRQVSRRLKEERKNW